jgi:hypothetical protein
MKRDQQHKMVQSLRPHKTSMIPEDLEMFRMLEKRDRDDEDLDALALAALNRLCSQYAPKRSKDELQERWKRLTGE